MCIYSWGGRYHPSNRPLSIFSIQSVSLWQTGNSSVIMKVTSAFVGLHKLSLRRCCRVCIFCSDVVLWSRWEEAASCLTAGGYDEGVEHKKLSNNSSGDQPPTTERLFSFIWTLQNHRDWSIWWLPRSNLSAGSTRISHFSLNQSESQRKVRKQAGKLHPNANRLQEVAHTVPLSPLTYFNLFLKPWYWFLVFCQPPNVPPALHYPSYFQSIINEIKII